CGLVILEAIEHARNLEWYASAHQDISHTGEHRAVDRRQMRQLNFLKVVNPDWIVVALSCENDFHKIGHDAQFLQFEGGVLRVRWGILVGCPFRFSAGNIVLLPDALRDLGNWELLKTPAHVAARIAVLQSPGKYQVQGCSRNRSKLSQAGYRPRQLPIGDGRSHSALNYRRKMVHDEKAAAKAHCFTDAGVLIV